MFRPPLRRPGRSDTDVAVLSLLVALLLVLLAGGGGFYVWQMRRAQAMRAEALVMELEARADADRARAEAEEAHALAQARLKEKPVEDILREGRRKSAAPLLERGLERCAKGEVNEGMLWFVRGLEQSGGDDALRRVFRANLAAWAQAQSDRKLFTQKGAVTALAVGPDGKVALTGGEDGVARAWEADSGQPLRQAPPDEGKVSALVCGADGKHWLVAHGERFRQIDATTGQPAGEPQEPPGTVLALTVKADGTLLLFGTCAQGVWQSVDGERQGAVKLFTPDSPVLSAALGSDARVILTGHEDHTARLWGAGGKAVGTPLRHDAAVRAVAVSPDGQWLATAAGKTGRLWDAATHLPVGRPFAGEADILALAFAPDGKGLLAGDRAGVVRRWPVAGPLEGDLPRLKLWVEVMAGKELDAAGTARPLNDATLRDHRQKLQALGGPLTP
jgi:WD40 repeat protein